MKDNSLPVSILHEMFEADFDRGVLVWKSRPLHHFKDEGYMRRANTRYSGKEAGTKHVLGYVYIVPKIAGRNFPLLAHRVLWAMKYGDWPKLEIDHIDRNPMNNSISNLRQATRAQNCANTHGSRQGLKGVVFDKRDGSFNAQISINGKSIHLGRFASEREAHDAYVKSAKEFRGVFACGASRMGADI